MGVTAAAGALVGSLSATKEPTGVWGGGLGKGPGRARPPKQGARERGRGHWGPEPRARGAGWRTFIQRRSRWPRLVLGRDGEPRGGGCRRRHVYVTAERAEKGPCPGPITRQGCREPRAVPGFRAECRLPPRTSVLVRTVAPAASCPGVSRGPCARAGTGAAACWCHGVRVSLSCARRDQPVPCCTRKS